MGPTWGPSGADRTQVGPMLPPWTLLFELFFISFQDLRLCCMSLLLIEEGAFSGLSSLTALHLSFNQLTAAPSLQHIRTIKSLFLNRNLITSLPKDYLKGCHSLEEFDIKNNGLLILPEMSYVSRSLTYLILSHNRLSSLSTLTGHMWVNLMLIAVDRNEVSHFQINLIKNMPSLETFDISHNQLQLMPDLQVVYSSIDQRQTGLSVLVEGNPWHCDYNLKWLLHGIEGTTQMILAEGSLLIVDPTRMLCHSPADKAFTALWDASKYVCTLNTGDVNWHQDCGSSYGLLSVGTMMTLSNENIFGVTGPLWGESTGHRWIPLEKASDAELWCFLWSAAWTKGWTSNRDAGDFRRHCA